LGVLTIVTRKSWHEQRARLTLISVFRFPKPAKDFFLKFVVPTAVGKLSLDAWGEEISLARRTYSRLKLSDSEYTVE
jgi:hypothetical protein